MLRICSQPDLELVVLEMVCMWFLVGGGGAIAVAMRTQSGPCGAERTPDSKLRQKKKESKMFLSALLLALPAFVAAISSGETPHTSAPHVHASTHADADAHSVLR
jgi:hypothetical protein